MSTDNSLVIHNGSKGSGVVAKPGSAFVDKDGNFDRSQIPGSYVRVQPGQKVEPGWVPQSAPKSTRDIVDKWISEHGEKAGKS